MSENRIENGADAEQRIVVTGRAGFEITEVSGVLSFDEEEIVLETGTGRISVEGEGLRITVLSLETGVVSAVGKINGILWLNESRERRAGFFGRKG
ncbi:MAG: sporulation protein YabP [Clostridia bacterium]|nr:sporulation protein YabP [Clostridia bacterium]